MLNNLITGSKRLRTSDDSWSSYVRLIEERSGRTKLWTALEAIAWERGGRGGPSIYHHDGGSSQRFIPFADQVAAVRFYVPDGELTQVTADVQFDDDVDRDRLASALQATCGRLQRDFGPPHRRTKDVATRTLEQGWDHRGLDVGLTARLSRVAPALMVTIARPPKPELNTLDGIFDYE
jgi:hypothetical protein